MPKIITKPEMEDNSKIQKFRGKASLFEYLRSKFRDERVILVHGSTATKPVKNFSDFDIELYGKSINKPYYELVFINGKPALLTMYRYKYQEGKKKAPPQNIRVIKGEYTDAIENRKPHTMYSEGVYNMEERIIRECQLIVDFCFKYFRSRDVLYLRYIQKRIK